jgi:IPT/TIG domain/PKD domain
MATSKRGLRYWIAIGALVGACSADSPSEPRITPAPPTPQPPPSSLSITASPAELDAGSSTPSTITVSASGATGTGLVTLTTSLGGFGSVGGPATTTINLSAGQAQAFLFAGPTAGVATISATVGSLAGSTTVNIRAAATFFISFLQPNTGSPQGGDIVNINGGGFQEPTQVFIGANPAQIRSVTPNRIQIVIPPLTSGATGPQSVGVTVTINVNEADQAAQTLANGFIYTQGGGVVPPQIFSITPSTGVNEGGTRFTINGEGFESPVQVLFGGDDVNLEAPVESVTRTQIVGRTPAATGLGQPLQNSSVRVRVRNLNTGLSADLANGFRYGAQVLITSIGPSEGPYFGGTNVTLHGQGFDSPVAVEYGGFAQFVTSVTGTEIQTRSGAIVAGSCADVSGPSRVVNIESGNSGTGPGFTYRVTIFRPTITSVTPSAGPQAGGTNVTITGSNFNDARGMNVLFGDRQGVVLSVSPDGRSMVVRTPQFPVDDLNEDGCDANGDGFQGSMYVPTSVDVKVVSLSTTCDATFAKGYTYNPTDASCRNDVGPPPPPPTPPSSSFTFSVDAVTDVVIFTNTSTGTAPLTYLWNFGDGQTSTQQNPVHDYTGSVPAPPFNYVVSLTVTNAGGTSTSNQFVLVP